MYTFYFKKKKIITMYFEVFDLKKAKFKYSEANLF